MSAFVTKADQVAAKGMLEHAFRNVGPRALRDVAFGDIAQAFTEHRIAETSELVTALKGAIGALEQDLEAGKDSGDSDWEGLAYQRLEAARAAIARAAGAGA